jgi:MoaA/NifB/PqqE/SkfB family radical SAM enzyme
MQKKIIEIIKEKTGSETFCVLPWIHLATRPNGDMRLCCTANASGAGDDHHVGLIKDQFGEVINLSKISPLSAWNSDFMKNTRLEMLNGKIPKSCTKCFEEEKNNIVSKRLWETYSWMEKEVDVKQLINDTTEEGVVPEKLIYLDLRLGHTCNLKCVMCSPHDSSRWIQDHEKLMNKVTIPIISNEIKWDKNQFDNTWYEKEYFWQDIHKQIPNLKEIYFAGGEPLLINEHKKFLLEIIKQGYEKSIYLRYNSNGLLLDEEIIEIWNQFKRVKFNFSIDALSERNNYIRYPSDWETIEKNLEILDNTKDHIEVNIACAVQLLNIKHLPEMIKWKVSKKYRKINMGNEFDIEVGGGLINTHLVFIPTWLDIRSLPFEDKKQVEEKFIELADWLKSNYRTDDNFWKDNPYGWSRFEGLIKFMNSADYSFKITALKEYFNNLDEIRSTNFKLVFPELAHLV